MAGSVLVVGSGIPPQAADLQCKILRSEKHLQANERSELCLLGLIRGGPLYGSA